MRKTILIIIIMFFPQASIISESLEDSTLKFLQNKTLAVNISTRVIQKNQETLWHMESSKLTISGRAVKVQLKGDNVLIFARITPFSLEDGTILLIAQGEVWLSSKQNEGLEYYTTLKSLPVKAGEKVLFFPLGVVVDSKSNVYTIELEIQVLPYIEQNDKNTE